MLLQLLAVPEVLRVILGRVPRLSGSFPFAESNDTASFLPPFAWLVLGNSLCLRLLFVQHLLHWDPS